MLQFPLHNDALAPEDLERTPGYTRKDPVLQVKTADVHMRNDSDVQSLEPLVSKKGHVKEKTPGYTRNELLDKSIESFAAPVLLHEQVKTADVHMRNVTVPTSYDSDVQSLEPLVSKKGHVKVELVEETWEESKHTLNKWILGKLEKDIKTNEYVLTWTVCEDDPKEPKVSPDYPIAVKNASRIFVAQKEQFRKSNNPFALNWPTYHLTGSKYYSISVHDGFNIQIEGWLFKGHETIYLNGPGLLYQSVRLGVGRLDSILNSPNLQYIFNASFKYPLCTKAFRLTVPLGERTMMLDKLQRYYTNQLFLHHTEHTDTDAWVPIQFKETKPRTLPPGTYRFRDSEEFTVSKYADSVTLRADDVVQRIPLPYDDRSPRWIVTESQQRATPKWIPFDLDQDYLPLTGQTYSFDHNCTTEIDSTKTDVEWWGPRRVDDSKCAEHMQQVNGLVGAQQHPAACRALNFLLVPPAQCNAKDGIVEFSQPSPSSLLDMTTIPPKTKLDFEVTRHYFKPVRDTRTSKQDGVVEGTLKTTTFEIKPTIKLWFTLKWPQGTSVSSTRWTHMSISTDDPSLIQGEVTTTQTEPPKKHMSISTDDPSLIQGEVTTTQTEPPKQYVGFVVKRTGKKEFTMTEVIRQKIIESRSDVKKGKGSQTKEWKFKWFVLSFLANQVQVTPHESFNVLYTTEPKTFLKNIKLEKQSANLPLPPDLHVHVGSFLGQAQPQQYDVIYNEDKLVMTLRLEGDFIIPGSKCTVDDEQDSFIRAVYISILTNKDLQWKYHTTVHDREISASGGAPFAQIKSKKTTQLKEGEAYRWDEQNKWLPPVTQYVGESPSETLIRTDVRNVGEEGKFNHLSSHYLLYDSIYTTEYGTQMVKFSNERKDLFYKAGHFYHYPGRTLKEVNLSDKRNIVHVWKDGKELVLDPKITSDMYTKKCSIKVR